MYQHGIRIGDIGHQSALSCYTTGPTALSTDDVLSVDPHHNTTEAATDPLYFDPICAALKE